MSDRWYERRFDRTYLQLYAHRDAREAERATRHLLAPLGLAGRRVLDLGCGAGRYVAAVQRRGARAAGLDYSAQLLAAAAAAGVRAALGFVRADMQRLPFTGGSFDLVLSMFTSFGYLESAEADRGVLSEVARVLVPRGAFVLDFLNAARVVRTLEPHTRRRAGAYEVHERRYIDSGRGVLVKEIELRGPGGVRRDREEVRLWGEAALAAALADAGLRVRARWGDYRGGRFDSGRSQRLVLLARAEPRA